MNAYILASQNFSMGEDFLEENYNKEDENVHLRYKLWEIL